MPKIPASKIIPTKAPKKLHSVDACVIWCLDPRFRKPLWDLEKNLNFKQIDIIKLAGGAKDLAGEDRYRKATLLSQVSASVRLHSPQIIVPMLHFDCGAYKPLNLPENLNEGEFLKQEIEKVKKSLAEFELPIMPVIVDFDKIFVLEEK